MRKSKASVTILGSWMRNRRALEYTDRAPLTEVKSGALKSIKRAFEYTLKLDDTVCKESRFSVDSRELELIVTNPWILAVSGKWMVTKTVFAAMFNEPTTMVKLGQEMFPSWLLPETAMPDTVVTNGSVKEASMGFDAIVNVPLIDVKLGTRKEDKMVLLDIVTCPLMPVNDGSWNDGSSAKEVKDSPPTFARTGKLAAFNKGNEFKVITPEMVEMAAKFTVWRALLDDTVTGPVTLKAAGSSTDVS